MIQSIQVLLHQLELANSKLTLQQQNHRKSLGQFTLYSIAQRRLDADCCLLLCAELLRLHS